MLKFSANLSSLFTEVELVDRFNAAKRHGFKAIEIQFPYALSAEILRNILEQQQLKLVLFNVDADDLLQGGEGLACVPEKREHFRQAVTQALEYAQLLRPEAINILPGRCLDYHREKQCLETLIENLYFAVEVFAQLGIKTVFEAINTRDMPGFIIHNTQQMLDVLNRINHPWLYMQYDIYHMQMMGEKPDEFIHRYADKIAHIQFADCPGRGQPGTGKINFKRFFSSIEKSTYSGWVGAEYKPIGNTTESLDWFS